MRHRDPVPPNTVKICSEPFSNLSNFKRRYGWQIGGVLKFEDDLGWH
jgi:hypothetical protein